MLDNYPERSLCLFPHRSTFAPTTIPFSMDSADGRFRWTLTIEQMDGFRRVLFGKRTEDISQIINVWGCEPSEDEYSVNT